MGHERLGLLPKSDKWRKIVLDIARTATGECSAEELVKETAKAIDARFRYLHLDPGIQGAFSFLLAVSVAGRAESPQEALKESGIDLHGNDATPLRLTQALSSLLRKERGSLEYAELAKAAVGRALSEFYQQETKQPDLLGPSGDSFKIWSKASDGAGFCVLARQFFSHLTAGYISYFLDREASAKLPTIHARETLQGSIEAHVDRITRYSFETSKIAQSFAAGWYNKNATASLPSRGKAKGFLGIAFNKIRDSLGREASS
ncbi:MAG: hypothetical protein NTX50_12550 [Candidatus Sumerlaeota bacterium]|nr:hypothetical protein [Candidatus Sumerlaeota bacterium]